MNRPGGAPRDPSDSKEPVRPDRAATGDAGEDAVCRLIPCPRCRRERHLTRLPKGFQCADVICKFCGFLAQVKATTSSDGKLPKRALGGSWRPQHEQILADIFHALFIVPMNKDHQVEAIYYIPSHVLRATPSVYEPRAPLAETAQRAGWTGFTYSLSRLPAIGVERVYPPAASRSGGQK